VNDHSSRRADRIGHLVQVFQDCYDDLVRFLTTKSGCRSTAEDLAQDVYLRVSSVGTGFQALSPKAFIYRVAHNLWIDLERRKLRRATIVPGDCDNIDVASCEPPPDRAIEAKQDLSRIEAALEGLPAKCRQALWLSRVEGLSHAAVAAQLGVSESMVAKYIARALDQCESALHDDE